MAAKRKFYVPLAILIAIAGAWAVLSSVYGGESRLWRVPEQGQIQWVSQRSDGPITVRIGTSRNAAYRLGDIIPVEVVVVAKEGVRVDLSDLQNGVLSKDGKSAFELAQPPSIEHFTQHGKQVWVIKLALRSWSVEESIDFSLSIPYGAENEDGVLEWWTITSPTVSVETTRSAQEGDKFDLGNRSQVKAQPQRLAHTFVFIGIWLILCTFAWYGVKLLGQERKRKLESKETQAWKVFDAVFADAGQSGFTEDHYIRIAAALRQYFDIKPVVLDDLSEALSGVKDRYIVLRTFELLEGALYAKRHLDRSERSRLVMDLETIVPRP